MDATSDQIAAAVTAELNGADSGTFDAPFVARQLDIPDYSVQDLSTLQVTVTDTEIDVTPANRAEDFHDYTIAVGLQKKVSSDGVEVKTLKRVVEQIIDYFRRRKLASVPAASIIRAQYLAHRVPEHLRDKRVFTGVVELTYQVRR